MDQLNVAPFFVSDYLSDPEMMADYLTEAMTDPNPDVFLAAIKEVAVARGMTLVAEDAGVGRESLYKSLSNGAHPRFETILKVMRALGFKLVASAVTSEFSENS
ncbi:MAG: putative addiction module antidote protein [Rhodospirillaceae bacterium]|nr:putative addiction module antidote protein [Rhodospirillales bacterium]MAX46785.1 putative addiction module antidote protein [Rhodospirillaceae bacterium]|tara:strand:- start:631 stop:942 length:312 start_codon:yes stop_codon:yes gene_type:complete